MLPEQHGPAGPAPVLDPQPHGVELVAPARARSEAGAFVRACDRAVLVEADRARGARSVARFQKPRHDGDDQVRAGLNRAPGLEL